PVFRDRHTAVLAEVGAPPIQRARAKLLVRRDDEARRHESIKEARDRIDGNVDTTESMCDVEERTGDLARASVRRTRSHRLRNGRIRTRLGEYLELELRAGSVVDISGRSLHGCDRVDPSAALVAWDRR